MRATSVALAVLCGIPACRSPHSGFVSGAADSHCAGVAPPTIGVCDTGGGTAAKISRHAEHAADGDGTMTSDYGPTQYGSEADDDDCKYHVAWHPDDIAKDQDVTFFVAAKVLSTGAPMDAAASPRVEAFLNDTHPAPVTPQQATSPSAGNFVIAPVRFDASGRWTVRFHFFERCLDSDGAGGESPHGHAAFYVDVP